MAIHSPVLQPHTTKRLIDPHQSGEYPILLGDSLKSSAGNRELFTSIRYNWRAKGNPKKYISTITKADHGSQSSYTLTLQSKDHKEQKYSYEGHAVSTTTDDEHATFALIFDEKRSAFILEPISSSVDFNLTSAPDQTSKDIRRHPQLTGNESISPHTSHLNQTSPSDSDQDQADQPSDDPYDFRNFLKQAEEHSKCSGAGDRTPIPGSRTPMSGTSSPVPGASRFHGTSSRPTPTSAPMKKRKPDDKKTATTRNYPAKSQPSRKLTKQSTALSSSSKPQALSKARISDSDDEMSDTITVARSPLPAHKSYSRDPSASTPMGRSPHIVVDDPSGLEIDMGSPPPESSAKHNRAFHINRDAFRSHTGTPRLSGVGDSSPIPPPPHLGTETDGDIEMEDADVEELELGSPRANNRNSVAGGSARIEQFSGDEEEDEDGDDELAAELEAALQEEEEESEEQKQRASGGFGLGISNTDAGRQGMDEDESEVSEEE